MKLFLYNTPAGLKPLYDDDFDEKKKLKVGQVYQVEIRLARNYEFLKKARALLNLAWEYLPEKQTQGFRTKENFRKYLTVAAGFTEVFYSPKTKSWEEYPRSWSFESMDEAEFQDLYNGIYDIIFRIIGKYVSQEEFNANLINF